MMLEPSPIGAVQTKKFVMWLFIIADAATFGAILFGYGYLRVGSLNWTRPFAFSPSIINALVMTVVLLTSSLTMLIAVSAAQKGKKSDAVRWLGATILLGVVFAALHLREWASLMGEGWSLSANPMGGSTLVGATFFGITGLHLLHVISGVIAIGVITVGFNRGRWDASYVETTGLYWHFVDLVWMFVFPLVYLLNAHA
ncbi:MAG TPA: cytochrome c oxidase subunit 3 [Gemmatimonadaceae bacterium]|jgi:heme/copper-type cytochrome/quinol oxidase subunit 3|nr:cytochrome c oxidase subunit 3 [Gemmatimonadaceae bacterium]